MDDPAFANQSARPVDQHCAAALVELPSAYATALRLHHVGADRFVIAAALGIDPDTVDAVIDMAERKLERLRETPSSIAAADNDVSSRPGERR